MTGDEYLELMQFLKPWKDSGLMPEVRESWDPTTGAGSGRTDGATGAQPAKRGRSAPPRTPAAW